jgi:dTMP kinase
MELGAVVPRLAGKFLVLDGPDGCGKTTQLQLLLDLLQSLHAPVVRLREPGGTPIGEQIRELLLTPKGEGMDLRCEMLLYMASRAQLVQQKIKPALKRGETVVADRYVSSTLAYQGGGGGLDEAAIRAVAEVAVDGVWPDLTIILNLPVDVAMARLVPESSGGKNGRGRVVHASQPGLFSDRIEQRDRAYHQRVQQAYVRQAAADPLRCRMVDAGASVAAVHTAIVGVLAEFFGG